MRVNADQNLPPGGGKLPADFSLYLDAVRFLAAALVVVSHLLTIGLIAGSAAAFIPDLGREAVIIFFVLSGFVIKFAVDQKHTSLQDYVVARCARIYSVALPVLLASFLVAALVLQFSDVTVSTGYQVAKAYIYIPFHLMFAGEFWNLSETPPWLIPYWSLSYEVWYYVLFGVTYYLTGVKRTVILTGVLLLVGFKLWLLIPVWLSGAWLYEWSKSNVIPVGWAKAGWALSLLALCAFKTSGADEYLRVLGHAVWPFTGLKLGSADRFLADYVVCAIVLTNFACARNMGFSWLRTLKRPVRAVSAYTFTLYLVHQLVLIVWKGFYPHDPASVADIAFLLLVVAAVTYVAGFVTERRKEAFERMFRGLYERAGRAWAAGSSVFQR